MRLVRWLDEHVEEVLLVAFSVVMVVVIAMQVFMRYVVGDSLSWSEELARFCFIWLVYIGISYGVKKQRHIKVDAMLILFKQKGKIVMNMIANIIFLIFAVVVIYYGQSVALRILELGQESPALHIPMGIVYLATPVGMGLTAIRLIQQLIKQCKALIGKDSFDVGLEHEKAFEDQEDVVDGASQKQPNSKG
ncbi:TRAP-type C4-dicarboxylate transport system permease small subunit [Salibacterium salarium]|uniref:TRAP transporter small permease n=1 Tax=Salibacterium salarium TaxID=284579 RepID=UPI002785E37A|nr:TRAP transporter small permease [Salibacterium salarium]MDQ0297969.1 TRAP-type C4-dicarboxylate transport system permease small subunit [Salibacterium salarium]